LCRTCGEGLREPEQQVRQISLATAADAHDILVQRRALNFSDDARERSAHGHFCCVTKYTFRNSTVNTNAKE